MLKVVVYFGVFLFLQTIHLRMPTIIATSSDNSTLKATIDKARSSKTLTTQLGEAVTATCYFHGNPQPRIDWIKDGQKIPKECTNCITEQDDQPGLSKLHITPFKNNDFGEYICKVRNSAGFDSLKVPLKIENGSNVLSKCQVERIQAKDPRKKLFFLPRCDVDGSYHNLQCSIHTGRCWCVERSTGYKVADPQTMIGLGTIYCAPSEDRRGVALAVTIIGVVLLAIVLDLVFYSCCNCGLIHILLRKYKNWNDNNKL